jgi:peptidoglycan/LPS O-acetylase OafA/YrhL
MYIFYRHVWNHSLTFGEVWPVALVVVAASVALAWMAYRFYDLPLRRWLTEKWLTKSSAKEK